MTENREENEFRRRVVRRRWYAETHPMQQIRIRKQSTVKRPQDIDTRTPSGKPLPY